MSHKGHAKKPIFPNSRMNERWIKDKWRINEVWIKDEWIGWMMNEVWMKNEGWIKDEY